MTFFDDNNPFLKIFETLSKDVQDDYKKRGESLYDFIDFETGTLFDEPPTKPCNDVESIRRSIQSGLLLSDLTEEEQKIMHNLD